MNMNETPTREELRGLLLPCNDIAEHHVLWVKSTGEVVITPVPKTVEPDAHAIDLPDAKLRFPVFLAGNEYVGPAAAADEGWIDDLLARLQKRWALAKATPNVEYAEAF